MQPEKNTDDAAKKKIQKIQPKKKIQPKEDTEDTAKRRHSQKEATQDEERSSL